MGHGNSRVKPNILIAPGPYKECLAAVDVANAMLRGIRQLLPEATAVLQPICDGGSGFVDTLTTLTSGRIIPLSVHGPCGEMINSRYGVLGDGSTAAIESAAACGLALVPRESRNPRWMSTYGVGELIRHAICETGCRRIFVGCGDSATNDCGIGCATALGVRFFADDQEIVFPKAEDLARITRIDDSRVIRELGGTTFTVAGNLTSVLCGPEGTSRIYGPQKGASTEDVEYLSAAVDHFVDLLFYAKNIDLSFLPGAGGAGGLAASLYAFCNARLSYSFDVIHKFAHLEEYLAECSLVLTGEGCADDRTATGKVACAVALRAKKYGVPVVAIVGSIAQDHEDIFYNGIDAVEPITEGPMTIDESMRTAQDLIERATTRVVRFIFNIGSRV